MKFLLKNFNKCDKDIVSDIQLSINSDCCMGGSIVPYHRLLVFKETQDLSLFIDFNSFKIECDKMFIIPSGQILYLPPDLETEFYCLNITSSPLNDIEKSTLYTRRFTSNKTIDYTKGLEGLNNYKNIFACLSQDYSIENIEEFTNQYVHYGKQLNQVIANTLFHHQYTINDLAQEMKVSPRTLRRICQAIFKISPQQIIRYYLVLKSMIYILFKRNEPISNIADELKFSDVATFSRYMKRFSGYSPLKIRELYSHLSL